MALDSLRTRAAIALVLAVLALHAPETVGAASRSETKRGRELYRQGLAYYDKGRYVEALRSFQFATFFGMKSAQSYFAQGMCMLHLEGPGQARAMFERALATDSTHAEAHYNLGLLLYQEHDSSGARRHFARAAELRPRLGGPHRALARMAADSGDLTAAERELRLELEGTPSASAQLELGVLLLKTEQPAEAATAFRHGLTLDSTRAALWSGLGAALSKTREDREAADALSRAVALDTADAISAFNLGVLRDRLGETDAALAAYREAVRRDSGHAEAHLNLGVLLARLGRHAEARPMLERYLALAPDSPRASEIRKALAGVPGDSEPMAR